MVPSTHRKNSGLALGRMLWQGDKLKRVIIPMFCGGKDRYIEVMRHAIALNGSFWVPTSRVNKDRGFTTFSSTAMSGYKSISQIKCREPRSLLSRVPNSEISGGVVRVRTRVGLVSLTPRTSAPAKKDALRSDAPYLAS